MPPHKPPYPAEFYPQGCPCKACVPADANPLSFAAQFHLCPTCGNKRCPGAAHHARACSGSNEFGQPGSLYERNCPTCTRPMSAHVCKSCSPDGVTKGIGCRDCRHTGMIQAPHSEITVQRLDPSQDLISLVDEDEEEET